MRSMTPTVFALFILPLLVAASSITSPIVDLGYAAYQGTFNATTNQSLFLSIRYAAPPLGKLRFQAPAPPLDESSLGVQLADTQPAGCPQAGEGQMITTPFRQNSSNSRKRQQPSQPEDCLFLNVFVSGPVNPERRMPVIVWIHGGGYVALSTTGMGGNDLITEAGGGIVVVNMEYRLGVFGFLPGQEVKDKGALNAGLLDQEAVLKWTQEFIHLFGGDKNQVTIWGESAGAGSVVQHLVAHGGDTQPPLFKQAMTSSTFLPSQYNYNDRIPEQLYSEFVQQTGCSDADDTFECLVKTDFTTLETANVNINGDGFFGVFVLVPVVDGDFIVERPTETILRGNLNGEHALLTMTNAFEGSIFVNSTFSAEMTTKDYITQLVPDFNDQQIDEATAIYSSIPGIDDVNDQAIAIMGESIFICPTYLLLQNFKGPVRKGLFAIPPGSHGSDVVYYFPSGGEPPFANPQFDASFAGAFTSFAKFDSDVNIHPVPEIVTPFWSLYTGGNTEMLFNRTGNDPDIHEFETDPALLQRCEFWKSVAPTFPQ